MTYAMPVFDEEMVLASEEEASAWQAIAEAIGTLTPAAIQETVH